MFDSIISMMIVSIQHAWDIFEAFIYRPGVWEFFRGFLLIFAIYRFLMYPLFGSMSAAISSFTRGSDRVKRSTSKHNGGE